MEDGTGDAADQLREGDDGREQSAGVGLRRVFPADGRTRKLGFAAFSETVALVVLTSPSALTASAWAEVAIERVDNRWAMQIGGVEVTSDHGNGQPYSASGAAFYIGRQASTVARDYLGYIDRFRVYRGNP